MERALSFDVDAEYRCSGHEHFALSLLDDVFHIDVDQMFQLLFTDSEMLREFRKTRRTYDIVLGTWPNTADESGIKIRNISYTLSINYSIGPKCSPSTERQIMYPDTQPGMCYLIDSECVNGGVPYADSFYSIVRYCITRVSPERCRLRVTSQVKYCKSMWGLIRNFIDKTATSGLTENFKLMAKMLRAESDIRERATGRDIIPQPVPCDVADRSQRTPRRKSRMHSTPRLSRGWTQDSGLNSPPVSPSHVAPAFSDRDRGTDGTESHTRRSRRSANLPSTATTDLIARLMFALLLTLVVVHVVLFHQMTSLQTRMSQAGETIKHRMSQQNEINSEAVPPWLRPDTWSAIYNKSLQLVAEMNHTLADLVHILGTNVKKSRTN